LRVSGLAYKVSSRE